ncbi:MAG TPA: cell division protein SepF [Candidatus Nanoarchaeia archaeon]|nr:cell division protein SepF [Candidatus Nanoarchaeia archaeon]
MRNFFLGLKEKLTKRNTESEMQESDEYVELGNESAGERSKVIVRPFMLDDFEDIRQILDSLREGFTVALINIKPLKEKDIVELKRAINKLKKTCDAIDGDIAGFGEDYIVAVPSFAKIHRAKEGGAAVKEEAAKAEEPQE